MINPTARLVLLTIASLAPALSVSAQATSTLELPAVQQLVEEGFETTDHQRFKLRRPLVMPGMPADEQRRAFEELVGVRRAEKYLQDSVVASFELDIDTLGTTEGRATVRSLDLYFVVHGNLNIIHQQKLLGSLIGGGNSSQAVEDSGFQTYAKPLDEDAERPKELPPAGVATSGMFRYRFPILDKVVVSGLAETSGMHVDGGLVQAAVSPQTLLDDPENPTQWRPIPRGAENDSQLGPAEPFKGFYCYLHATQLAFIDNAVLVECHAAYVEPYGWFNGRNLLASKLPLLMQQSVRDFRRELKEVQSEEAAD